MQALAGRAMAALRGWIEPNLRTFQQERQPLVWALALLVGLAAGAVAITQPGRLTPAASASP